MVDTSPSRPPLGRGEVAEAEAIAAGDERVAAFLRGRDAHPLTRPCTLTDTERHDPSHRYAAVVLRPGPGERWVAVVDLTARDVVHVLAPEGSTGGGGDEGSA